MPPTVSVPAALDFPSPYATGSKHVNSTSQEPSSKSEPQSDISVTTASRHVRSGSPVSESSAPMGATSHPYISCRIALRSSAASVTPASRKSRTRSTLGGSSHPKSAAPGRPGTASARGESACPAGSTSSAVTYPERSCPL